MIPKTQEDLEGYLCGEWAQSSLYTDGGLYYTHHDPEMRRFIEYALRADPELTVATLHASIIKYKLLYRDVYTGWITRYGEFYSCLEGRYLEVLKLLAREEQDVRQMGWVKVTKTCYQCDYQPSRAQYVKLTVLGWSVKERDRALPVLEWRQQGRSG